MSLDIELKIETILEYADTGANLAEKLDDPERNYLAETIIEGFYTDKESRLEWETQYEDANKLAAQVCEQKSFPWPNAANVKYPLITLASIQFAARAYPSLINERDTVKGRVVGYSTPEKEQKAWRVGTYMTYQLHEEMEEWDDGMDKLLHIIPIVGTCFKKSYFDPSLGRNVSELVLPKDLVVNYYAKSLEHANRKTHILYFYKNEILERIRSDQWIDYDLSQVTNQNDDDFRPTGDQVHGLDRPSNDEDSTRKIIEQHCWLDLDGDDYKEPYIATVDLDCRKLVRLIPRFNTDSIQYGSKDQISKIKADEYFTKFGFIPDTESSVYDLGFGRLLGPLNETVNTTINQLLDAGTLSNLQGGFLGRGIRVKGGMAAFKPGEWKVINSTGDDIKKSIFPLPVKEPSNVLFQLLGMMVDIGQRVGSVSDMMTGESPGQNQPYSTTVRVLEEGMRVFSSIHKRTHRALKKEYKLLASLNFKYLEDQKYFTVLDTTESSQIGRMDFDPSSVDVIPASDPDVMSEALRLAKAEQLLQMGMSGMVNMQVAIKRALEAQNQPGIEELMQMPPPQPNFDQQVAMKELELKQMEQQMNMQLEQAKLEIQAMTARANAMLAMAKAEAADDKTTLESLKTQLEALDAAEERALERQRMGHEMSMVDKQNKMKQSEEHK